jgi:hypothetical protein
MIYSELKLTWTKVCIEVTRLKKGFWALTNNLISVESMQISSLAVQLRPNAWKKSYWIKEQSIFF